MNSKTCSRIIVLTLFATLVIPVQLAAQDKQDHHHVDELEIASLCCW